MSKHKAIVHSSIDPKQGQAELKKLNETATALATVVQSLSKIAFDYSQMTDAQRMETYGQMCVAEKEWKRKNKNTGKVTIKPPGRKKNYRTFIEQYANEIYGHIYTREFIHLLQQEITKFVKRFEKLRDDVKVTQRQIYMTNATIVKRDDGYYLHVNIFKNPEECFWVKLVIFDRYATRLDELVNNLQGTYNCRVNFDIYRSDYHLMIDYNENDPPLISDRENGYLGFDFNNYNLCFVLIDKEKNIKKFWRTPHKLNTSAVSYGQKKEEAKRLARKCVNMAKKLKVPLVGEALGSVQGTKKMSAFTKLAHGLFFDALQQRCVKPNKVNPETKEVENYSIELIKVIPNYTSKIGGITHAIFERKYSYFEEGHSAAYRVACRAITPVEELEDIEFINFVKADKKRRVPVPGSAPKWFLELYVNQVKTKFTAKEFVKKLMLTTQDKIPNLTDEEAQRLIATRSDYWKWKLVVRRGETGAKKERKYMIDDMLFRTLQKVKESPIPFEESNKNFIADLIWETIE